MSGFSWPLATAASISLGSLSASTPSARVLLPAITPNITGSLTWILVNLDGTVDMRPNEMDIVFVNGAVRELTDGALVLDQRIRKSVTEVQGSNQFAPGWGSIIVEFVGEKILSTNTLREIGHSVSDMFEELITLQTDTLDRIDLEPAELIDSVDNIRITAEGTLVSISVRVITQAKTVEEILIPGALNVVQN